MVGSLGSGDVAFSSLDVDKDEGLNEKGRIFSFHRSMYLTFFPGWGSVQLLIFRRIESSVDKRSFQIEIPESFFEDDIHNLLNFKK